MRTSSNKEMVPNAQVLQELKIGRTTLHEYRKKLGIDGVRERGKVYISRPDVERLKAYIKGGAVDCEVHKHGKDLNSTEQGCRTSSDSSNVRRTGLNQSEQPGTRSEQGATTSGPSSRQEASQTAGDQNKAMEEELRRQIADLKAEIIKKEKKVESQEKQLIHGALEIGIWRGKAQTYEEELRLLQGPKSSPHQSEGVIYAKESGKQPFNRAGEGSETVYAEVVDKEDDETPAVVDPEHDNLSGSKLAQKKTPQKEEKRERKKREKEKRKNEEGVIHLEIYDAQPASAQKWWRIWSKKAA